MIHNDNDDTISFVRSHRAPRTKDREINPIYVLVVIGVILLLTSGYMINANLKIV